MCRIVEARSGRLIRAMRVVESEAITWSPDGTTIATPGRDNKIYLWDAASGHRKAILEGTTNGGLRAYFHPSARWWPAMGMRADCGSGMPSWVAPF